MPGYITQQIDVAQLAVAAFFVFFAALILYLRREDKREGYPLEDPLPGLAPFEGFPPMPAPKVYRLLDGGTTEVPHRESDSRAAARPLLRFPGAPLIPVGDPMLAEVGPGAYPMRRDEPMVMDGRLQTQPLRIATDWSVARGDADPRGMQVLDSRRTPVGTVVDLWVDRAAKILRYLEVQLLAGPSVLLPIYHADINQRRRTIRVGVLLAHQFAYVPALGRPDRITAREEDKVNAYYAGGLLYSSGAEAGMVAMTPQTEGPRHVG